MSERKKGFILLFLIFGVLLALLGIIGLTGRNEKYSAPVYISTEFKVTCEDTYTVTGQLTNRTDKSIYIDKLIIRLTGSDVSTTYYGDVKKEDIFIPPNGTYDFFQDNISYPSNLLKRAHVEECVIDGVDYNLKYSKDGVVFDKSSKTVLTFSVALTIGIILLGLDIVVLIIHFIRKKNSENDIVGERYE